MPGISSITDSSKIDWALSVTGPYESTAIVTGPMPRKPKATRPKANTAGASISAAGVPAGPGKLRLTQYAAPMSAAMTTPIQYALKLPAVNPARMFNDAPPSFEASTTSRTCPDFVDVNTFTTSGM